LSLLPVSFLLGCNLGMGFDAISDSEHYIVLSPVMAYRSRGLYTLS
jgi:hypothetical protein